jgi:hypothetical protein
MAIELVSQGLAEPAAVHPSTWDHWMTRARSNAMMARDAFTEVRIMRKVGIPIFFSEKVILINRPAG